ncbi:Sec-independent protein translocase subunit TatB [Pseudonocardiaceae bacterium YIM PH 21723]|nr:Sec-independent protein translocase subunit TatB [Pseudonocardiaceae bacterium YIM PH 21723]
MFNDIGMGEVLVLLIVGLFVLGPERLPEAAANVGKFIRKAKEFATGARDQLRQEIGPEFDEFRKPIEELGRLRNMSASGLITQHLLNDDQPVKPAASPEYPLTYKAPDLRPLEPGERPPIDPDAT